MYGKKAIDLNGITLRSSNFGRNIRNQISKIKINTKKIEMKSYLIFDLIYGSQRGLWEPVERKYA